MQTVCEVMLKIKADHLKIITLNSIKIEANL